MRPTDSLSKPKRWKKKEPPRKPLKKPERLPERRNKLSLTKLTSKPLAPNLNCNKLRIQSNKFLKKKNLLPTHCSNFKAKSLLRKLKLKLRRKLESQLKKRKKPKKRLPRKLPKRKPKMKLNSKKNKKKKPLKRLPKSWLLKPKRRPKLLPLLRRLKKISMLQQLLLREHKKLNKEN